MKTCSITKNIEITNGTLDDYNQLAKYHYRSSKLRCFAAIFKMLARIGNKKIPVGVIVYSMPTAGLELRNVALGNIFSGFDRATQMALINKNIRRISRVVIEPKFRCLGLASRLVRETLPLMNVPVIEALAVMGEINPFFEKASMTAFTAKEPARCVQMLEAFDAVGIGKDELVSAEKLHTKIEKLPQQKKIFTAGQIRQFLMSYGSSFDRLTTGNRNLQNGKEQMAFVISKLGTRPVYYVWLNKKRKLKT